MLVNEFPNIDQVIDFNDSDGSAIDAIKKCLKFSDKVIFANGGDRGRSNTPEQSVCEQLGVELLWGIGGEEKLQSSSSLTKDVNTSAGFDVPPVRTRAPHSES